MKRILEMCYWIKCIISIFYFEYFDLDCCIEDIIVEREILMYSYSVYLFYLCREIEYN